MVWNILLRYAGPFRTVCVYSILPSGMIVAVWVLANRSRSRASSSGWFLSSLAKNSLFISTVGRAWVTTCPPANSFSAATFFVRESCIDDHSTHSLITGIIRFVPAKTLSVVPLCADHTNNRDTSTASAIQGQGFSTLTTEGSLLIDAITIQTHLLLRGTFIYINTSVLILNELVPVSTLASEPCIGIDAYSIGARAG